MDESRRLDRLWLVLLAVAVLAIACREVVFLILDQVTGAEALQSALVNLAILAVLLWLMFRFSKSWIPSEQQRLRESLLLLDIATAVGSTLELKRVLQLIATRSAQACGVHRCSIFLLENQRLQPLMSQYASGDSDRLTWETFRRLTYVQTLDEVPILKQVVENRLPLVLNSAALSALPETWVKPFGVRSLLIVPLVTRDTVIGLMVLDQIQPLLFSRSQVNLATTIGSQAAAALENARLYQQTLDDNRMLKEMDRVKSEIVANVSHELRSPLASIKAYTELLLDEARLKSSIVCQQWLEVINRATDSLTLLVNDSLSLSRLEAGGYELAREPLDLGSLVNEAVSLLRVQAEPKGIGIQVDVARDLPPLWADPELIRSIVRNLVGNAIKFSREGGTVRIRVWAENDHAMLSVRDQGIGMGPEALKSIFVKFYRAPESTDVEGTGLGLALVKQAVDAHRGDIQVQSEAGKGSEILVALPLGRATPAEPE
jgi:signal transduction histidine kinase